MSDILAVIMRDELERQLTEERTAHAAARKRLREAEDVLRALLDGTRDPGAHGLGKSWAVEYEMPPSVNERVRKMLTAHFAAYPEPVKED